MRPERELDAFALGACERLLDNPMIVLVYLEAFYVAPLCRKLPDWLGSS